jgi:uncharacterized protein YdeI (YjbR/CyaY-like superfamily)
MAAAPPGKDKAGAPAEPAELAGLPVHSFASQKTWTAWLKKNHASAPGTWIRLAKKASGIASVTYAEALDAALCHGWIDGQRRSADDSTFLQRFTPRTARSIWSKINRDKVTALIAAGHMQPAGLKEVERAKKDGRWDAAYDAQSVSRVPDNLAAALKAAPTAASFFETLDSRNRYAILFRLQHTKTAATREKWVKKYVEMLVRGETLHPPRKKRAPAATPEQGAA